MSYQFARGMVVQKNTSIEIKLIKKQDKLPFVISFHFKIITIFNNPK